MPRGFDRVQITQFARGKDGAIGPAEASGQVEARAFVLGESMSALWPVACVH